MNITEARKIVSDDPDRAARLIQALDRFFRNLPNSVSRQWDIEQALGTRTHASLVNLVDAWNEK